MEVAEDGEKLNIRATDAAPKPVPAHPTVLLVDDNRDLLHFLERLMADAGWRLLTAESATDAKRLVLENKPDAALLDYMLPDGNGVEFGVEFVQIRPGMLVIRNDRNHSSAGRRNLREENDFPVLRKPFLAADVMAQIRTRLRDGRAGLSGAPSIFPRMIALGPNAIRCILDAPAGPIMEILVHAVTGLRRALLRSLAGALTAFVCLSPATVRAQPDPSDCCCACVIACSYSRPVPRISVPRRSTAAV